MAKIYVLQTGSTLVSSAVPDRSTRKSELAYTGLFQSRKKRISVPVKAFLIKINGRNVLVDTGWSELCESHPIKHLGLGLWFASEPVMKAQSAVKYQLERFSTPSEKLDAVILTHLDCDHASGLDGVKNAKHIYTSKEEYEYAGKTPFRYKKSFWKDVRLEFVSLKEDKNAPFGKSCNLFGDGSVTVYLTPGHSAGSLAVVVNDSGRFAVLAGDDGYNSNSWDNLALPGPIYNKEAMKKTLKWVADLRSRENCAGVFAAHDPAVEQGIYEI